MVVVKDHQIQSGQVIAFLLEVVMVVGIDRQIQLGQVMMVGINRHIQLGHVEATQLKECVYVQTH